MQIGSTRESKNPRIIVCASLELAWVAEGKTDAFISLKSDPFGTMAGALLVKQAGGTVTDVNGKSLCDTSTSIVASNGMLHQNILQIAKN